MIDETGNVYGELTVVCQAPRTAANVIRWHCICSCGNEKYVSGTNLRSGNTISCGCRRGFYKHGNARRSGCTSEYYSWQAMKSRCYNVNSEDYPDYGGRGIIICDRWLKSFQNFLDDMGEKPSPELTIERHNVNGNYEPNNCYWATSKEQGMNRRPRLKHG